MSSSDDGEQSLLRQAVANWGTFYGLVPAVGVCLLVSLAGNDWLDRLLIFLLLATLTVLAWSHARWQWWGFWKKPQLRFLVGVYCDDPAIEPQIEEDFTRELRLLIRQGNLGQDVVLVQATRAECKYAEGPVDLRQLMMRKRAHVFVYGRIKRRAVDNTHALYVELRAAVAHAALEEQLQKNFAKEMTSVFPSGMLKIPANEQLPQLKLTADWVAVSTRYILSLAAGLSGDLNYAEKMLFDAIELFPRISGDVAKRTKINERLLKRLNDLYRAQAMRSFFNWRKSRERSDAERLKAYLEKALERSRNDSSIKQMLATTNFILTGDAVAAEKELRAAMFDNPAVYASLAFAYAMQGKYSAARKAYKDTWKRGPADDVMDQITSFFDWFKNVYPDFAQQTIWCESVVEEHLKGRTPENRKRIEYLLRNNFGDSEERMLLQASLA